MQDKGYLVVFDVDGTLVDSQSQIMTAMQKAFKTIDLPLPTRDEILSTVGLSLDEAFVYLLPNTQSEIRKRCAEVYKTSFAEARSTGSRPEFYPGMLKVLTGLKKDPNCLLGIATGKSRRGLNALLESHDMTSWFSTLQVADDHPSKPDPSMIWAALDETGIAVNRCVLVGDTSFDIDMDRSAGVFAIGVGWGYHANMRLASADRLVYQASDLLKTINEVVRK